MPNPPDATTPDPAGNTVVLVEDDPREAELALRAMRKSGLAAQPLWLPGGEEALEYFQRRDRHASRTGPDPRVVLLDLKMPRVDGKDVLRALKADPRTRRIPVVVMTSSSETSDLAECYDLGANSYVVKPVTAEAVGTLARATGDWWLSLNRTADAPR